MTWYEATALPAPARPPLKGDTRADVCVVGGGYAGLSAALHLAKAGLSTVLIEAASVGSGASGRNGGQLHTGQRQDQDWLERHLGDAAARQLWDLAEQSKALVHRLIYDHAIACDLRAGLIHAAWKRRDAEALKAHAAHMQARYGFIETWLDKDEIARRIQTTRYYGGVFDSGAGHLHALNYARGLGLAAESAGATLHENTRALGVTSTSDGVRVRTAAGTIAAKHVVLACDTWLADLDRKAGAYALPINSFVAVTAPLGEDRARALIPSGAAVADTKFVVDYYRVTPDHRLLFGGGETYTRRYPADLKAFVAKPMLRVFPQLRDVALDYAWGGAVGVTRSRLPHFGWSAPNIVYAHGFSGQGVALATQAGELMAEAVQGTLGRLDVYAGLKHNAFPGGRMLRTPLQVLGMAWYALKDRL
ncbi:Gamma-glutamylputrescine oxidoreductase [Alphaproteobacteria bacterium SO-S41]|nr:Gamma-glutamylputrescine oxidoreductase [Alphaproteobacteria bacterium SO-S41]